MNERLRKAKRMLAVQSDIDRLADWRLVDIARNDAVLSDQRRVLIGFLDAESAFTAPFAAAMMRRLQRLEESRAKLNDEMQAQSRLRLEERRRLRRAQQIVGAVADEARRLEDRRNLFDAIEAAAAPPIT